MFNRKFTVIITLICAFLLFFALSGQAKMQPLGEDGLAQVSGQEGISLNLNQYIYATAASVTFYPVPGSATSYIQLPDFYIGASGGKYTDATKSYLNAVSNLTINAGYGGGTTMLDINGLTTTNLGIDVNSGGALDGIVVQGNITLWPIANSLSVSGLYMGVPVTTVTPNITSGSPDLVIYGASGGSGIRFYQTGNAYINQVQLTYGTATGKTSLTISGIYNAGPGNTLGGGDPNAANWTNLTGNAQIGNFTLPTYYGGGNSGPATIDAGYDGTQTKLVINLPMTSTIGIRSFDMGWGTALTTTTTANGSVAGFGPIEMINSVMKMCKITLHN